MECSLCGDECENVSHVILDLVYKEASKVVGRCISTITGEAHWAEEEHKVYN